MTRGRKTVTAYGDGGFRIAGERIAGSVIVFPARAIPWPVAAVAEVGLESLAPVVAGGVEILLLGCGRAAAPVGRDLAAALRRHGIAIDAMTTGAACRSFNLLVAEERAVAAALIAV